MKKLIALLLAGMMCLSLIACGGGDKKTDEKKDDTKTTEPAETDKKADTEKTDAEKTADGTDAEASGDWYDYADVFTVTYYGATDAGEAVAFVMNDDESYAVMAVADPDSMESVSFVGKMTSDEATSSYTITDENNGLALTFTAEFQDDNSVNLDLGDLGKMTVLPCEQSEAFDLLNEIDAQTVPVA